MENRINRLWVSFFVISVYFMVYLIVTIFQSNFWGNILSPIGAFLACGIILNTYLKSGRKHIMQKNWLVFSMACFSWGIGDLIWAFYYFALGENPTSSNISQLFYMGTDIFLFIAILFYSIYKFRKWNAVQLIVDSIAISIASLLLLWILFFDKNLHMLGLIGKQGVMSIIIVFDVITFVSISIWYLSIRGGKVPRYIQIISAATAIYVVTDIYCLYLYLNNYYVPNSVIDSLYMFSLLAIAVGARWQEFYKSDIPYFVEDSCSNIGIQHRGPFLFLYPVLIVVFKGFVFTDLVCFVIIIIVYESLTFYIQVSIKNEQLLHKEKHLNIELENRIAARTKELVEKNKLLDFLSNQDTVTNLYNRRHFIHVLDESLGLIDQNEMMVLLFIDIDRFKTINDTYGHYVGDQVLIEFSKRLQVLNTSNTFLARLGGDEFVFAIQGNFEYDEIEKIAEQVIECCDEGIKTEGSSFHLTISIGISIYPLDAKNCEMLMKNADIAMYQAKKQGFNKYVLFNEKLNNTTQRNNEIEMLLKKANYDNEFMLFYQPQFSIVGKKLVGMEALLRWNSPEKGSISPAEFIPIAEEMNYIVPIGDWLMKKAIEQIADWNNCYNLDLKMGINVSPKQLDQVGFINHLQFLIEQFSIKPEWVDVEITEGVAMEGEHKISEIAHNFKDIGVSISIDDFGTGYSSLSYLKFLPFDRIKIAKSLIDAITADGYDQQIIKFIIMLAKSIGIKTIAEGVEHQEQFDLLAELGCEEIQGYLLGKPMPPLEFEETFLRAKKLSIVANNSKVS